MIVLWNVLKLYCEAFRWMICDGFLMDGLDLDLTFNWWVLTIFEGSTFVKASFCTKDTAKKDEGTGCIEICGHARDPDWNTDCQVFHTVAAPRAETYLKAISSQQTASVRVGSLGRNSGSPSCRIYLNSFCSLNRQKKHVPTTLSGWNLRLVLNIFSWSLLGWKVFL